MKYRIDKRELLYTLLMLIPMGKVVSYRALADLLRISPRTVARYLAHNDKPIIIPCHRVVKRNRNISGYTPYGKEFKMKLLKLEGVCIQDGEICSYDYYYDKELLSLIS